MVYYENNEVCRRNRTKQAIIIVIIMMVGFLATPIFALASDFCRFWQEIYKWQRESEKSLVSCFVSPPKIGIYSPKFELRVELHTVVRLWHVPFAEIQIVSQKRCTHTTQLSTDRLTSWWPKPTGYKTDAAASSRAALDDAKDQNIIKRPRKRVLSSRKIIFLLLKAYFNVF